MSKIQAKDNPANAPLIPRMQIDHHNDGSRSSKAERHDSKGYTKRTFKDDIGFLCGGLEDYLAERAGGLRKRRSVPLSEQSELEGDWIPRGGVRKDGKRSALQDPENPSLQLIPNEGKPGYGFFYWFDGPTFVPPFETSHDWTLSDAQQAAKIAEAVRLIIDGHGDRQRMDGAVEHVETTLDECERLHRILDYGITVGVMLSTDPEGTAAHEGSPGAPPKPMRKKRKRSSTIKAKT